MPSMMYKCYSTMKMQKARCATSIADSLNSHRASHPASQILIPFNHSTPDQSSTRGNYLKPYHHAYH